MRYQVGQTGGDGPVVRLGVTDRTEAVLQSVAVVLGTRRGSVPLYRGFGLSWDLVDRPVQTARAQLFAQIRAALKIYVPEVELVRVDVRTDPDDPGRLIPVVEVEVVSDGKD